MSDSFQTTTSQNWFQRIQASLVGILVGIGLFIIGIALLWWNEGHSVAIAKSLKEGRAAVVSAEVGVVNPENENKLVHVVGNLAIEGAPKDSQFGISADAVKLNRHVEMYQWSESKTSETKQKLGGGEETVTTYKYAKDWSSSVQKSSDFEKPDGHTNPGKFPFESKSFEASDVSIGAYTVGDVLLSEINWFEDFPLADATELSVRNSRIENGIIYIGADSASPQVSDLRISYQIVPLGEASVMGRQSGDTLTSYPTKVDQPLVLARAGNLSADEMFTMAESDNAIFTWILRFIGFICILIGLNLIANPFSVIASVLPFAGNIVGMFTGFAAFIMAAAISLLVIAVAWLAFRPVLGITLLLLTGALIGWGFSRAMKKKPVKAA